jgi:hypothetical protein
VSQLRNDPSSKQTVQKNTAIVPIHSLEDISGLAGWSKVAASIEDVLAELLGE